MYYGPGLGKGWLTAVSSSLIWVPGMWLSTASIPPTGVEQGKGQYRDASCSRAGELLMQGWTASSCCLALCPHPPHCGDHIFLSPMPSCHQAGFPGFRQDGSPVPAVLGSPKGPPSPAPGNKETDGVGVGRCEGQACGPYGPCHGLWFPGKPEGTREVIPY